MEENRTLNNNKVTQFILRIDIDPGSNLNFEQLVADLKPGASSYKVELHSNFPIDVNAKQQQVNREEFLKHILGYEPSVSLLIDTFAKAIIFRASHYVNNAIYKSKLTDIIENIKKQGIEVCANRIGMRYINEFPCSKNEDISKVFNTGEASSIKVALGMQNISRIITMREFETDDYRKRIQFGIPNKYYPARISNMDLLLDIDVYVAGRTDISHWEDIVSICNHAAYDTFEEYVKPAYRKTLV